ncbi:hypothetical protein M404DRAFT_145747 [Pisolithus tinctorius Marx 270]|uniref:Uncharacterized protein n=1 Tax=Pisolithus tinctorius Marx 270 TaxID=870435 RepID=A0A0C3NRR8_PISTI|nr:hypothetical protein M404DRAFT_145747 [Pisolithus tinctorius Marx 270]
MSTTTVVGFFALLGGHRVQSTRGGNGAKTYHCFYDSTVQCTSSVVFPVQLRVYSPFNDMLLVDDSVAYVIARAYIPSSIPHDPILLEAVDLAAVPGDPSSEEYEATIPDSPCPYIFSIGSVTTWATSLPDGVTKAFSVMSSDFVHNVTMSSTVV